MNEAEAVQFARTNHRATLATRRGDGGPQLSLVVVAVDEDGRLLISTREPAMKVRNLRRTPHAWLCVQSDKFFGGFAQLEGPAEVIALPEAMPLLEFAYRQIAGEHPDWDDFRRAMQAERRVVLRITVTNAGPTRSG